MKVWLIRHGLTRLGEEKRYQGRLDEGLSEGGKAALAPAPFSAEHIYVSPARRARETAAILFPQARQIVCLDLREMDFGSFEGRGWWEMEQDEAYRIWVAGGCRGRCPGGEDRAGFTERICAAFDAILDQEGETEAETVIVAHGGTQMALLGERGNPQREYYLWQRPCGCGWLLETDEQGTGLLHVVREISFLR